MSGQPFIFVTVGTDHHPFHRLINWCDSWISDRGLPRAQMLIQCGTSRPPRHAYGKAHLGRNEIQNLLERASAVVTHGGPASIMQARAHGHLPIVVPRVHRLGEHVDDHQVRFAHRIAAEGYIVLASTRSTFHGLLDQAVSDTSKFSVDVQEDREPRAVQRFAALVSRLFY